MTRPKNVSNLSDVEQRILVLFNRGLEDDEIAEEMGMDVDEVADIIDRLDGLDLLA